MHRRMGSAILNIEIVEVVGEEGQGRPLGVGGCRANVATHGMGGLQGSSPGCSLGYSSVWGPLAAGSQSWRTPRGSSRYVICAKMKGSLVLLMSSMKASLTVYVTSPFHLTFVSTASGMAALVHGCICKRLLVCFFHSLLDAIALTTIQPTSQSGGSQLQFEALQFADVVWAWLFCVEVLTIEYWSRSR